MSDVHEESQKFAMKTVDDIYNRLVDGPQGSRLALIGELHGERTSPNYTHDAEPDVQALYATIASLEVGAKLVSKQKVIFAVEFSQEELDWILLDLHDKNKRDRFLKVNADRPILHAIDYADSHGYKIEPIDLPPDKKGDIPREQEMQKRLSEIGSKNQGGVVVAEMGSFHLRGLSERINAGALVGSSNQYATVDYINAGFNTGRELEVIETFPPYKREGFLFGANFKAALQVHAPQPLREAIRVGSVTADDIIKDAAEAAAQYQPSRRTDATLPSPYAQKLMMDQLPKSMQLDLAQRSEAARELILTSMIETVNKQAQVAYDENQRIIASRYESVERALV
jgi:hypothetical protein